MKRYDVSGTVWEVGRFFGHPISSDAPRGKERAFIRRVRREVGRGEQFRIRCVAHYSDAPSILARFEDLRYRLGGGRAGHVKPDPIWDEAFRQVGAIKLDNRSVNRGLVEFAMRLQRMHIFLPVALSAGVLGYLATHQQVQGAQEVFNGG